MEQINQENITPQMAEALREIDALPENEREKVAEIVEEKYAQDERDFEGATTQNNA